MVKVHSIDHIIGIIRIKMEYIVWLDYMQAFNLIAAETKR